MPERMQNVLFLCTGNSARSIMAEVMLNHLGRRRFQAFSAGSHPTVKVNPLALETMRAMGFDAAGARSKAWVWPGKPAKAHWGIEDPAAVEGSDVEKRKAFREAADILRRRIEQFVS